MSCVNMPRRKKHKKSHVFSNDDIIIQKIKEDLKKCIEVSKKSLQSLMTETWREEIVELEKIIAEMEKLTH
jgi:cobalamin biosynthesis Co2+ chelatase CbiK